MLKFVFFKGKDWRCGGDGGFLVPDAQEGVPGAGGNGHAVLGYAETGHAVVVSGQDA